MFIWQQQIHEISDVSAEEDGGDQISMGAALSRLFIVILTVTSF